MKQIIIAFIFLLSFSVYSRSNDHINNDVSKFNGIWKAVSKVETRIEDGKVIKEEKELYQLEEKSYEFTASNKLIIKQGFGYHQESLPFYVLDNRVYIGKEKENKILYLYTFKANTLTLVKSKSKIKKDKVITVKEIITLVK